jgi:protein TonB
MAGKIDLYDSKWIDLVFRGRNQEYGAYEIRRLYPRNAFLGIVLSIVLFTLAVSAPLIIKLISDAIPEEKVVLVNNTTDLEEPPPVDKNQPATPPPPPPPPLKSTIKFTPPEIKPDAEVPDEPPPTQDKLQDVDAGKTTVEGDPNADVDLSGLEDGTGDVIGEEQVFLAVEQQPEFPGGESALIEYIGKNTKYPAIARENNIEGRVFISFVVEKDGNISDVKVVRGIGGGCDEEAKRVIKGLPRFTPGKQNGRPVRVQYNVPVNFKLM